MIDHTEQAAYPVAAIDFSDLDFSDDNSVLDLIANLGPNDVNPSADREKTCGSLSVRRKSSKIAKKAVVTKSMKSRIITTYTGARDLKPNMSRRTRDTMLYSFPSFDRCDSLLFFPSTLARYLNTGDIPAIAKLFQAHVGKNHDITSFKSPEKMSLQALVKEYEFLDELHPDQITCIHHTKVDGNQISAVGYMKFTHCKSINLHVARLALDTRFKYMFRYTWDEQIRRKIDQGEWPAEEKQTLLHALEAGKDFLMYSRFEVHLTIDDSLNKIKAMSVNIKVTSMQAVESAELL